MPLFVVATPIGSLEDITLRALRVLREADAILAEDTRRTRKLCAHHGVATPLRSFHAHTGDGRIRALVEELAAGASLALVTDAGTPVVSDPGARLTAAAAAAGVEVVPVPGPSALTAALSVAAVPASPFRFLGFLPRGGRRRRELLDEVASGRDATVLFEAPGRVGGTLVELAARAPGRGAAVCRELTKVHEEIARGTLAELSARFAEGARGEITLVVGAIEAEADAPPDEEAVASRAAALLAEGLSPRDAARRLATDTGLGRREAYARVLAARDREA